MNAVQYDQEQSDGRERFPYSILEPPPGCASGGEEEVEEQGTKCLSSLSNIIGVAIHPTRRGRRQEEIRWIVRQKEYR